MDNLAIADSVLNSIKKLNGVSEKDTSFDVDFIIHINNALLSLHQVGLGDESGVYIEDSTTTWLELAGDPMLARSLGTYVYVKVRLVFDPPASPTIVEALKSSADESLSRILYLLELRRLNN